MHKNCSSIPLDWFHIIITLTNIIILIAFECIFIMLGGLRHWKLKALTFFHLICVTCLLMGDNAWETLFYAEFFLSCSMWKKNTCTTVRERLQSTGWLEFCVLCDWKEEKDVFYVFEFRPPRLDFNHFVGGFQTAVRPESVWRSSCGSCSSGKRRRPHCHCQKWKEGVWNS